MTSGAATERPLEGAEPWRQVCLGVGRAGGCGRTGPTVRHRGPSHRIRCGDPVLASRLRAPRAGRCRRPVACPSSGSAGSPTTICSPLTGWPCAASATESSRGRSCLIACDVAVVVAWHIPATVAAESGHGWVAPLEAVTLLVFGLGLWLELVVSPPLLPRSGYLRRAVLAGLVMWAFWILAYWTGLSTRDVYRSFPHVAGGLSAAADQQIASAVLWFAAAVALVPVVFWNALRWLQTEDAGSGAARTGAPGATPGHAACRRVPAAGPHPL